MRHTTAHAAALAAAALLPLTAQAVTAGQTDTFSGSLDGWSAGGGPGGASPPTPPKLVAGGGPAGAGDSFMQVTAQAGGGAGSRLTAMNALAAWSGNYIVAGVTSITMDLINLGGTDLTIRLLFEDPIPGPPQNSASTLHGVPLPVGSGWVHASFPVAPADLEALEGSAVAALSNTTVLRLYHGVGTNFPGDSIAGVLGVDNIQAVPEPRSWALMLAGLVLLGAVAGRRRH